MEKCGKNNANSFHNNIEKIFFIDNAVQRLDQPMEMESRKLKSPAIAICMLIDKITKKVQSCIKLSIPA